VRLFTFVSMAPENVDRVILNIRWNRITAIVSIITACLCALLWSNRQVTNIMNAIRDNTKDNELIRHDVADMRSKLDKQGEKIDVLWYEQTEKR